MTKSYFLLTCFLAISLSNFGECSKCFVCSSATDPKCKDPVLPEESRAVQCTTDVLRNAVDFYNDVNKKLSDISSSIGFNLQPKPVDANLQCSKIDITDGDNKLTIRGCSMPPTQSFDPCKELTEKYTTETAKVSFCEICKSDYCNSATSFKASAILFLPSLAILLSYYY